MILCFCSCHCNKRKSGDGLPKFVLMGDNSFYLMTFCLNRCLYVSYETLVQSLIRLVFKEQLLGWLCLE
jgi:hypothetical protein